MADDKQRSDIMTGVIMIALGLIFLGDRLGATRNLDFGQLWPVILLALGFAKFLVPAKDGSRGGFWLIFLGTLFLLNNYRVLRLHESWPLFIVAGGVSILIGSRRPPVKEQ